MSRSQKARSICKYLSYMTLRLEQRLSKRKALHNLRQLRVAQNLIDFSSNDYLGLARSPQLAASTLQEWGQRSGPLNGLGSTGSRLLSGNSFYIQDLEEKISSFHGFEAGLLFNCGYMANVGLLSSIGGSEEMVFFDTGVHASTHDGIRLSRSKAFPFRHNDLEHLKMRLQKNCTSGDRFICIESVYSTDGSSAPLPEICRLAKEYGAHVIVDEAHAVGACGPEGRGLVAKYGLTSDVFAQITTFGKALGTHGAIVLGSSLLKEVLINFATSYIYTTALPHHALAAIKCSYDLLPQLEEERSALQRLIRLFSQMFPHASSTHIQSLPMHSNRSAKETSERLREQGFDVRALTSPTVQRGHESLRICLHAFNTEDELLSLQDSLKGSVLNCETLS